jgi:hypothetical protein
VAADLIERGQAAAAGPAIQERANGTEAPGTNEPGRPTTGAPPLTAADRTSGLPAHVANDTNEPTDPPAPPPLNRHQRRRLAALARRGLHRAA